MRVVTHKQILTAVWGPAHARHQLADVERLVDEVVGTEGPTYIQSKQLDYAAKNITGPSLTTVIADPQNPTLLNQGSADG
jgi:hypothetical protein